MDYREMDNSFTLPLRKLKTIDEIRRIFFETTHLGLSLYDTATKTYEAYSKNTGNTYCKLVQKKFGVTPCMMSNTKTFKKACRSEGYEIFKCHAGLTNITVPIKMDGKTIGLLCTEHILTEKHISKEEFKNIFKERTLKKEEIDLLYKHYLNVTYFDKEKILLAINLIMFLSDYLIAVEKSKVLEQKIHEKEKKILEYENERVKLKNTLQGLSINILQDKFKLINPINKSMMPSDLQKKQIISRAEEMIKANFTHPLSCEQVASAVYLSPNYFGTIFHKVTGLCFKDYLNQIRIEEGKKLLRETTLPIKQIYSKVGYEDYNYFNRVFKKYVGVPPATYRNMIYNL